ncbi:hydroxypyruvate isomerase [Alkalilimnicola ehrlichii]|uniref:Hydroxypyruvate isomerase n=1 Tax=Alkalilimnicola ehrlichii TaxID=351052 RepID=A0A3E0WQZ9_9GAMM|nr:TIM barrel protein [Alkalilimnicola ehrlichii]RFA27307.1 hydroxypyruvate isomerase [Alkalilimnicola ehrlichii]RFA34416.1 hydroxypyruvate isomerase [Alkalilimnicola ehrlichii]
MPHLIANLSLLFTEHPFLERFAAARRAGFDTVEVQFPYEFPLDDVRHALADSGLRLHLINLPAGDWAAGDRGIAADPNRIEAFHQGVALALLYAEALGVRHLNCLAGRQVTTPSRKVQWQTLLANLRHAATELATIDATLLVEPINRRDIPDFFLGTSQEALQLIAEAEVDNLRLQYDIYHMQRSEGELAETLRRALPRLGHIQLADNPGRHQPGTGEINFRFLLTELDRMGYRGSVSLEYNPLGDTESSLSWIAEHGFALPGN